MGYTRDFWEAKIVEKIRYIANAENTLAIIYTLNPEESASANGLPKQVYRTIPAGYEVWHKNPVKSIRSIVGKIPTLIKK